MVKIIWMIGFLCDAVHSSRLGLDIVGGPEAERGVRLWFPPQWRRTRKLTGHKWQTDWKDPQGDINFLPSFSALEEKISFILSIHRQTNISSVFNTYWGRAGRILQSPSYSDSWWRRTTTGTPCMKQTTRFLQNVPKLDCQHAEANQEHLFYYSLQFRKINLKYFFR